MSFAQHVPCNCGRCAILYGDQAYTEAERLIDHQREQIAELKAQLDGAIAETAAAVRLAEREAIVALIQNEGERRWGCWDPALIAAIRARGQQ